MPALALDEERVDVTDPVKDVDVGEVLTKGLRVLVAEEAAVAPDEAVDAVGGTLVTVTVVTCG